MQTLDACTLEAPGTAAVSRAHTVAVQAGQKSERKMLAKVIARPHSQSGQHTVQRQHTPDEQ
jgi:hypothetical protein